VELIKALETIDATLGMFRSFVSEIDNGDFKEEFLQTPVNTSIENFFDEEKNEFESEIRFYYNYVEGGTEYKRYIVDIRPVCRFLVNEWPSNKAKRIRKKLQAVTVECSDYCEYYLGGIADVAKDEGFSYDRYMRGPKSCDIETVMLDTIHEMCHALRLTDDEDNISHDNNVKIQETKTITEEDVKSIDWLEKTQNFNPDCIRGVIDNMGETPREKKIIIKAIYDAESDSGEAYKIPYSVDKLLDDLYKKYDEKHNGFLNAYDHHRESLDLDIIMEQKLKEIMNKNIATDADIDEIFDTPANSKNNSNIVNSIIGDDEHLKVFKSPNAILLMKKLSNAGLLTNDWKPVELSIAERGYLAGEISDRLHINAKWKVFGKLWNENPETLRQGNYKAAGQTKTSIFIEKLKKILG